MRTPVGPVILWVTSAGTTLPRSMPEVSQSFWSSMQNELLSHKKWATRVELPNGMFEYIEVFYNRRRRQSPLGYASPIEYERTLDEETA